MLLCAGILEHSLALSHTGCLDSISSRYLKYFYFFMAVSDKLFLFGFELIFFQEIVILFHCGQTWEFFYCLLFIFACHLWIFSHAAKAPYADWTARGKEMGMLQAMVKLANGTWGYWSSIYCYKLFLMQSMRAPEVGFNPDGNSSLWETPLGWCLGSRPDSTVFPSLQRINFCGPDYLALPLVPNSPCYVGRGTFPYVFWYEQKLSVVLEVRQSCQWCQVR